MAPQDTDAVREGLGGQPTDKYFSNKHSIGLNAIIILNVGALIADFRLVTVVSLDL